MKLGPAALGFLLLFNHGAAGQSALATVAAGELVTSYGAGSPIFLSAPEVRSLPHETVSVREQGQKVRYAGVPLSVLLVKSGLRLDDRHEKDNLATYVLIQSVTDEQVVLALAEVLERKVLIADTQNGKSLPNSDGPYRLIVPGDSSHRRWVRQVFAVFAVPASMHAGR